MWAQDFELIWHRLQFLELLPCCYLRFAVFVKISVDRCLSGMAITWCKSFAKSCRAQIIPLPDWKIVETYNCGTICSAFVRYCSPHGHRLSSMVQWWVKYVPGGNLWNYVAWHRQSNILLCHTLSFNPTTFITTKKIAKLDIITNQLNTLFRKYYFALYFLRHISATIKT
jgi:hypothetical protein